MKARCCSRWIGQMDSHMRRERKSMAVSALKFYSASLVEKRAMCMFKVLRKRCSGAEKRVNKKHRDKAHAALKILYQTITA
jgi:hypothetical protein